MRGDRLEVQLARVQEDDGLDGGRTREATRSALGGLEQAVDGLKESVGLTGLRPGNDAVSLDLRGPLTATKESSAARLPPDTASPTRRYEGRLPGAQSDQADDGFGSTAVDQAAWQRSFKRPGGPEDVQTLPTAVHSPCFSPPNASDDRSAPTADIVPSLRFELGRSSWK